MLALTVDGALLLAGARAAAPAGARAGRASRAAVAALVVAVAASPRRRARRRLARTPSIRVGSKNFTEQIILGEIVAQALERATGVTVERRLNLGGTFICDRALRSGDIDVYVEYTGTAVTAVFKQPRRDRSARACSSACASGTPTPA